MTGKLKYSLSKAITKYKIKTWLLASSVLVIIFCSGVAYGQTTVEADIVTQTEYVPTYIVEEVEVIQEVQVTKEVYPTEFQQFGSQEELGRWQAEQYLELKELAPLLHREPHTTIVRTEVPLWNNGVVAILVVLLMGVEWIVRRRYDLP